MKVNVQEKEIVLFCGATVKDALLRYFTKCDMRRDIINHVQVKDQWGHELDLDAPLSDEQYLTFSISEL